MALEPKHSGALVLRLIVGLALLGWPRVGAAQGTWSVILFLTVVLTLIAAVTGVRADEPARQTPFAGAGALGRSLSIEQAPPAAPGGEIERRKP